MRNDLHGLEISPKELQQLTNLPVKYQLILITNPLKAFSKQLLYKMQGSEGATVIFISLSIFVSIYVIFYIIIKLFVNWLTIPSWLLLLLFCFVGSGAVQFIFYLLWRNTVKTLKQNMTNSLQILLSDVDRYNGIIKAIDINDQIEAAGNPDVSIQEREKVIEALQFTRADLVRALKTERILRENKNFILGNTDLFTDNLASLTAMQVTEQASEHGKLLNEALQIALDVQYEMKKLQSRD